MKNGYILGPILIVFGACISYYTGMLIVKCSEYTGRTRYEDIALKLYGPKVARITSGLNLVCLIGFEISYIVFVSNAVLDILKIENSFCPKVLCSIVYSFFILFPMSLPRNVSALIFKFTKSIIFLYRFKLIFQFNYNRT